jgi:hypothetical protein
MFRLNKSVGCALILLSLLSVSQAAPLISPLSQPLTLQQPALLRNNVIPTTNLQRPVLTAVTPVPCVSPGAALVLVGQNLGTQGRSQLVMDTGSKQQALVVTSWTARRISSRLPARFLHHGKVEIGIRLGAKWLGTPLPVTICGQSVSTPVLPVSGIPTAPVLIERSAVPSVPAAVHGGPVSSPLTPPATANTPAPEPANESVEPAQTESYDQNGWAAPADNSSPAPAGQSIGGGNLLGMPLPALPKSLNLLTEKQNHQRYQPHELLAVTSSMADAKRLAQVMQGYQARIIRRSKLGSLGMVISAFRLPDQASVADTLKAVRQQYPDLWMDMNHYFYPLAASGKRRLSLYHAIDRRIDQHCGRGLRLGMLDGPVDMTHPALSGQAIVQKQLFTHGRTAAATGHATAVASLLVGNSAVADFGGVISEASLSVAVVMQTDKKGNAYSTAENLLSGLNWLLNQQVQVVNLSLGGPRNALLEVALQRTLALQVGVVAAAGNGGSEASPSYPAAQAGVVAVTAVDSDAEVARDANHGDYIDLAAPGVDVWVATPGGGGKFASGSSMAAPLVAAALAQLGGKPARVTQLFQQARDLGVPGKDPVYGWGLLQFPACAVTQN